MQAEDRLILSCVKLHPDNQDLGQINDLILQVKDWDYLISTIIDRGIGPLMYKKLPLLSNSHIIPDTVRTKLQQSYYITFSRSTMLYAHFSKAVNAFNEAGIKVIALKGIYLSEHLYIDSGLRQFSDIDLLVNEEDGIKCISILEQIGYKPSGFKVSEFVKTHTEIIHFPPMISNGVSIEIHTKLHKKREVYSMDMESVWKNAIQTTINGAEVFALDLYNQLIYLCLHLDKHFKGGHVQFTCFNDITNFLEKHKEIIQWEQLISTCKWYQCENVVFEYLIMVNRYINAALPANIIEKYSALLSSVDMRLFERYLQGDILTSAYKMHSKNMKQVVGFWAKLKYSFDLLFPPKAFMVQLYKIRKPWLIVFYYPYRHYIGLKGIIMHIIKR